MGTQLVLAITYLSLLTFLFVLLWAVRPTDHRANGPRADRLPVIDQHGKLTSTSVLNPSLHLALNQLSTLKRRVLILRFGLVDGQSLSGVDVGRALYRSERNVARLEVQALGEIGPRARGMLEELGRPRQHPRDPDSGGYQTSGRPLPVKPIPPSLSAAAEVALPEPDG
jgi:hypothetical protein